MHVLQHPAAEAAATAPRVLLSEGSSAAAPAPYLPPRQPASPLAPDFTSLVKSVFFSKFADITLSPSAATTLTLTVFVTAAAAAALTLPTPTLTRAQQSSVGLRVVADAGFIAQGFATETLLGVFSKLKRCSSVGVGFCKSVAHSPFAAEERACIAVDSLVVCGSHKPVEQKICCRKAQHVVASCPGTHAPVQRCSTGRTGRPPRKLAGASAIKAAYPLWGKLKKKAILLFPPVFLQSKAAAHSLCALRGAHSHLSLLTAIDCCFNGVSCPTISYSTCYHRRVCVVYLSHPAFFFPSLWPLGVFGLEPYLWRHFWRYTRSAGFVCSSKIPLRSCARLVKLSTLAAPLRSSLISESLRYAKTHPFNTHTYSSSHGCDFSSRQVTHPSRLHSLRPHNYRRRICTRVYAILYGLFTRIRADGCETSRNRCGQDNTGNTTALCRSRDSSDTRTWSVSSRSSRSRIRKNAIHKLINRKSSRCRRSGVSEVIVHGEQRTRLMQSTAALLGVSNCWSASGNPLFSPTASGRKMRRESQNNCTLFTSLFVSCDGMEESSLAAKGAKRVALEGMALQLEPQEQQLFDMLTQCVEDEKLGVDFFVVVKRTSVVNFVSLCADTCDFSHDVAERVLRAAGGWVRDKLLNRHSDDIDIAIDNMTGVEFAGALNRTLQAGDIADLKLTALHFSHAVYGAAVGYLPIGWLVARGLPSHTIGVVASNPEQSKHLETATCRLLGRFQVDFVHLRTETYSEGSRIPKSVTFGSPAGDASRRDFTVNALFYNLKSREIEDFTGTGLQDLRSGLLRTPLPDAEVTLLDDPLRILRAVRFASRFGFTLHPDLVRAAQLDKVQEALLLKVSRERFGIELKKMIPTVSVEHEGASACEGKRSGLRESLTGLSSRSAELRETIRHIAKSKNTSGTTRVSKETTELEEPRGGANGGDAASTDMDSPGPDTSGAHTDDNTCAPRISAAARCVCEALGFLVRMRVVSYVFKLPERVLAQPLSPTDGVFCSRSTHEQQELVSWDRDAGLQNWWVCGLRCSYALATILELCSEGTTGNAAEVNTVGGSCDFAIAQQFGELIEHEHVCFRKDFSGFHFRALMLGAFLFPTAGRFYLNGRSKREKLLTFVLVESLKLSRKDADQTILLAEGALAFLQEVANGTEVKLKPTDVRKSNVEAATQLDPKEDFTSQEPTRLGLLIRNIGQCWRQALLIAAAVLQTEQATFPSAREDSMFTQGTELQISSSDGETVDDNCIHDMISPSEQARSSKRARPHPKEPMDGKRGPRDDEREASILAEQSIQAARAPLREDRFAAVLRLYQKIKQGGLEEAWKVRPIYDGHAVKKVLPNLPRGPIFKEVQDEQVRWQLANPSRTSHECALHLKKLYKQFL